jgi:hypothetical protein
MASSTNKPSDSDKTKQSNDSSTKVHFSEKGAYKYFRGKRKPISIRIDPGLYKRFKPLAKHVYGSVCRAVEIYMVAIIEVIETGVHFSDTEQPIKIDKIVIERNLRPRRKLAVDACGFGGCDEPAVAVGMWRGKEKVRLCEKHLLEAKGKPGEWEIVTPG